MSVLSFPVRYYLLWIMPIFPVDVPEYCQANPSDILPDSENCAHYFNCSDPSATGVIHRASSPPLAYRKECHYPDLFDPVTKSCQTFTATNCSQRKEPQAPCKYLDFEQDQKHCWKYMFSSLFKLYTCVFQTHLWIFMPPKTTYI